MKKVSGYIFTPEGDFRYGEVQYADGRIQEVNYTDESCGGCEEPLMILPGLVDLHLHGAAGADLCDGSAESIQRIAEYEASRGVAAFLGATMTLPKEELIGILDAVREYGKKQDAKDSTKAGPESAVSAAKLLGVCLEGPFLDVRKIGAQNAAAVIPSDVKLVRHLQERSENAIRVVVVAPTDSVEPRNFVHELENLGALVSLGHTAATYEETKEWIAAGAHHGTHLYNAMDAIRNRAPGAAMALLLDDKTDVEIIADGEHLHDAMVEATFRMKRDHVILISDSCQAVGMPDGDYTLGGHPIVKKGTRAILAENPATLAGSVSDLYDCMVHCIHAGIPAAQAIFAATRNPARSLGVQDDYGTIEVGKKSMLLMVDGDWRLRKVLM